MLTTKDFTPISTSNLGTPKILNNQIDAFNKFCNSLPSFIKTQFEQNKIVDITNKTDSNINKVCYGFKFNNIHLTRAVVYNKNNQMPITPNYCRTNKETYSLNINGDVEGYTYYINKDGSETNRNTFTITNANIGAVPCMVGSQFCTLYNKDMFSKISLKEDPEELGGQFIIDGGEKAIIATKSVIKNSFQIHHANGKDNVDIKCDITSQYGDDFDVSYYLILNLLMDGNIVIRLDLNRDVTLYLPFHVIYMIFGMVDHKNIFDTIIPNFDENNNRDVEILSIIKKAMLGDYINSKQKLYKDNYFSKFYDDEGNMITDSSELLIRLAEINNEINVGTTYSKFNVNRNNNEQLQSTINVLLERLDSLIFPHIGIKKENRLDKLRFLGSMIKSMCGVKLGDEPTDRNTLVNQLVSTSLLVLIMSFRTIFNLTVVTKIINEFQKNLKTSDSIESVKLRTYIDSALGKDDLKKGMCKAIKAGNKPKIKINKQNTSNRVITVILDRTNHTSILNSLRSIQTTKNINGKTNKAVIESRSVHPTYSGSFCMIKSVEGGSAGIQAELTISNEVSDIVVSAQIRNMIREDSELEALDKIYVSDNSRIIFNGNPIGSHPNTIEYAKKLREMRRSGKIDRNTSIIYHPLSSGDLEINTQKGRILRPLVIVYSNWDEYIANPKSVKFRQWVKFTKEMSLKMAKGEMTITDMVNMNVIEFISPIEYKNIYVAQSIEFFNENAENPVCEFTHVDLPLSNFGMTVLSCPFINNSALVRACYSGNHERQTLGIPLLNYYSVYFDKLTIALYYFQPLAETIINRFMRSNGAPLNILVSSAEDNQEDSLILYEGVSDYDKYSVIYHKIFSKKLESDQAFAIPRKNGDNDVSYDYSHMNPNGTPKIGTLIKKDMPVIGVTERDKADKSKVYDKSIICKKKVTMIVYSCKEFNFQGYRTMTVGCKLIRKVAPGDKFAARSGGKAIISDLFPVEKIPVSNIGTLPDAILNPHAFPSRMIPNQIIEAMYAKIAIESNTKIDMTTFNGEIEFGKIKELNEKYNLNYGLEHFYNDVTGEKITNMLYIGPTFYKRLSKMIEDQSSAVDNPRINPRTQQITKGINDDGGSRLGEMEKDTWFTIGAIDAVEYKMFKNSDRKKVYICNTCKKFALVNKNTCKYLCNYCEKMGNPYIISELNSCHNTFQFTNYLAIVGIGVKFNVNATEIM